jgi:uncharacterized protein YcbX
MTAKLDRITIYPIKSLDGVDVECARVLSSGALEHDRQFAIVDAAGKFVNGKRTAAIHSIRAEYDLAALTVRLGGAAEFSLREQQSEIAAWLSDALGPACQLVENTIVGFPDDVDAPGPTLISTSTLAAVASWFPGFTLDETRRRFRANLELSAEAPFWEDRLVGDAGDEPAFRIGEAQFHGVNPCQRCVVPTRDTITGASTTGFQKAFATERERHLPACAPRGRFNHFYRLAVNTRLAPGQSRRQLRRGETVTLG